MEGSPCLLITATFKQARVSGNSPTGNIDSHSLYNYQPPPPSTDKMLKLAAIKKSQKAKKVENII